MTIRSISRLIDENPWGLRVYDANFRGDFVTLAQKRNRSSRRRGAQDSAPDAPGLLELTDLKHSVCPMYLIRLDDDRVPMSFYEEQAIARNIPLVAGIGASQIDRNSISDFDATRQTIKATAQEYVDAIRNVANTIAQNGYDNRKPPWPGTIYFEDISSESSFELIEIIVDAVLKDGALR